jgi:hypothetical protein
MVLKFEMELQGNEQAELFELLCKFSGIEIKKASANKTKKNEPKETPVAVAEETPAPMPQIIDSNPSAVAQIIPTVPASTLNPVIAQLGVPCVETLPQTLPTTTPTSPTVVQTLPTTAPTLPTVEPTYTIEQLSTAARQLLDAQPSRANELIELLQVFQVPSLAVLPKESYHSFVMALRNKGVQI